jgi:hypothetical protein
MIQDMLTNIYDALINDSLIESKLKGHIFYYDDSNEKDTKATKLIIKPLRPPQDQTGGSDQGLTTNFLFQLDVQSTDRKLCKQLQAVIRQVMAAFSFAQLSDGLDEYFADTGMYVDARRYEGNTKLYDTNY